MFSSVPPSSRHRSTLEDPAEPTNSHGELLLILSLSSTEALLPPGADIINESTIALMKPNVVLINTSRGGLVDAKALEHALRKNKIGGLGMDVYENEQSYFFHDCSDDVFDDETLTGLLSHHNVIITAHQVRCPDPHAMNQARISAAWLTRHVDGFV